MKTPISIACAVAIIAGACLPAALAKNPIPSLKDDLPQPRRVDAFLLDYGKIRSDKSVCTVYKTEAFRNMVEDLGLKLFGGPVIGDVTDRSAKVWMRTTKPAEVRIVATGEENPAERIESNKVRTAPAGDMTGVVTLESLKPLATYRYNVLVDGKRIFGEKQPAFRTYPSRGQKAAFRVAFGGGARVNPPKERMWNTVAAHRPLAFLFLGDNVYIDRPKVRYQQRGRYYRRQLRPEYQRLSSGCAIYAIWDDHDFGDNNCAGGPDLFKPEWKPQVWKVFKENWVNPYYGGGEERPGCWFDFSIGDVDFFMTDGRYYRNRTNGTMLGPHQKKWLLKKLAASEATFKVLVSGTPWCFRSTGSDSWSGFREEREQIFSLIDRQKIGGVVLLSADRHRTDVWEISRPEGYTLHEFSTSKLTNGHTHDTDPQAKFSYNKGNFFGLLEFDLAAADPTVTFKCVTIDDKEVYELKLRRSELQAGK